MVWGRDRYQIRQNEGGTAYSEGGCLGPTDLPTAQSTREQYLQPDPSGTGLKPTLKSSVDFIPTVIAAAPVEKEPDVVGHWVCTFNLIDASEPKEASSFLIDLDLGVNQDRLPGDDPTKRYNAGFTRRNLQNTHADIYLSNCRGQYRFAADGGINSVGSCSASTLHTHYNGQSIFGTADLVIMKLGFGDRLFTTRANVACVRGDPR